MGPINRPRGIVALTAAVAPHSLSCLVSRHAPLGPRDIDGGLDRLRFGSDAYISLYDGATNLLRGGNPVITISKQKGVVPRVQRWSPAAVGRAPRHNGAPDLDQGGDEDRLATPRATA